MVTFRAHEWSRYGPESTPAFAHRYLDGAGARQLAENLCRSNRLLIAEGRNGLDIRTTSYVGTLRLGDLDIVIEPKLRGLPLLRLLRYAYGLRDLGLFEAMPQGASSSPFQDLLIQQLAAETTELISRGLNRNYRPRRELLESPRGRIDFSALARRAVPEATLPCVHHPRLEDTLPNRALLAGLRCAVRLTRDLALRARLRGLIARMGEGIQAAPLTPDLLNQTRRHGNRLTEAYGPALTLIGLLQAGMGAALQDGGDPVHAPGFLFDMNRFFQALVSRFLHEHLTGLTVRDEHPLKGMLAYDPSRNPRKLQDPTPRPDFIVKVGRRTVALLDTKYRDVWAQGLPREMLYQLVIYAMSQEGMGRAIILYPTLDPLATEACIAVRSPLAPGRPAEVVLRPIHMERLERILVNLPTLRGRSEAEDFARLLVHGN